MYNLSLLLTKRRRREAGVLIVVALGHCLVLWGLHQASLGTPPQVIIPVRLIAEFVMPTALSGASRTPEPGSHPHRSPAQAMRTRPAMASMAVADVSLTALAPAQPAEHTTAPVQENRRITPAERRADVDRSFWQVPEIVVRPSGQAKDGLNLAPPYPAISLHLGEAGRVVVRVLIGPEGQPLEVVLQRSSGFDRLDQISLETVRTWRFDPALYPGATETRWAHIPINFVRE